jgi:nickel-dependent lactate racemase
MKCDFKIVIGACVPHPSAGFGGGGKLVMPGIASFQTIRDSHSVGNALDGLSAPKPGAKPAMGMGIVEGSKFKAEIDESAELAGIDFLINPVLGLWGEAAEIFSGSDFRRVHAEAVKLAIPHYKTPKTSDKDVVICNAYAKANEFNISLVVAFPLVSPVGGDIVITCNAPDGQVTHYNAGLWGKTTFSALYRRMQIPDNVRRVLFYNEYPQGGNNLLEDDPKISYFSRWEDVLTELQRAHGAGTRVAVVPDGTNQYFEW